MSCNYNLDLSCQICSKFGTCPTLAIPQDTSAAFFSLGNTARAQQDTSSYSFLSAGCQRIQLTNR